MQNSRICVQRQRNVQRHLTQNKVRPENKQTTRPTLPPTSGGLDDRVIFLIRRRPSDRNALETHRRCVRAPQTIRRLARGLTCRVTAWKRVYRRRWTVGTTSNRASPTAEPAEHSKRYCPRAGVFCGPAPDNCCRLCSSRYHPEGALRNASTRFLAFLYPIGGALFLQNHHVCYVRAVALRSCVCCVCVRSFAFHFVIVST